MLYFVGVSVFAMGRTCRVRRQQDVRHARIAHPARAAYGPEHCRTRDREVVEQPGRHRNLCGSRCLIGLGVTVWSRFGTSVHCCRLSHPADPRFVLNSFGVICFGLVGLELASVMGDEIRDPQKTLPGAVAWGGLISGALYNWRDGLTLVGGVGKNDISVLQGIVQAVSHMAGKVGVTWIHHAVCFDVELVDCGHWFGLDGRVGAHSVCRRP